MPDNVTRTQYFAEVIPLSEAELDATNHAARVTIIAPGWSQNNRYYREDVLAKAAPVFEGAKAYANHPSKSEMRDRPERDIRDLVGYYENVRPESDGRITGDLKVVGEAQNWLWSMIETTVNDNPNLIGVSINALGKARKGEVDGKKGVVVEDIVAANSADIVTTPAAGGKFESLLMSSDSFTTDLLAHIEIDELREARPDIVDTLKKEWKTVRDTKALEAAREDNAALQEQLDAANTELAEARQAARTAEEALESERKQNRRALWESQVDMVLASSKLPGEWQRAVRPQLLEAEDADAVRAILDREATKARSVKGKVPVTGAGRSAPHRPMREGTRSNSVSRALGVGIVPKPGESPAEYAARKRILESQRA